MMHAAKAEDLVRFQKGNYHGYSQHSFISIAIWFGVEIIVLTEHEGTQPNLGHHKSRIIVRFHAPNAQ